MLVNIIVTQVLPDREALFYCSLRIKKPGFKRERLPPGRLAIITLWPDSCNGKTNRMIPKIILFIDCFLVKCITPQRYNKQSSLELWQLFIIERLRPGFRGIFFPEVRIYLWPDGRIIFYPFISRSWTYLLSSARYSSRVIE